MKYKLTRLQVGCTRLADLKQPWQQQRLHQHTVELVCASCGSHPNHKQECDVRWYPPRGWLNQWKMLNSWTNPPLCHSKAVRYNWETKCIWKRCAWWTQDVSLTCQGSFLSGWLGEHCFLIFKVLFYKYLMRKPQNRETKHLFSPWTKTEPAGLTGSNYMQTDDRLAVKRRNLGRPGRAWP